MDEDDKSTAVDEPLNKSEAKKRRKWPWVVGSLVLVFIVIPVLVLGYLGFVPGLSGLMGATKPKDLGVRYSQADFTSYQQKTGRQFLDFANAPANPLKPGKKTIFADPQPQNTATTQEEITAAINLVGWSDMPITNAQVRFGDGTVEMSGNIDLDQVSNFVSFIGGVGYSQTDIDKALSWGKRLAGNPPIYIRASAAVTNNVLAMQVQQVQIGRFNAPLDTANTVLSTGTINALKNTYGLDIQSATFSNGQLHFAGTAPTTVYVKKN
jgi:hypothetical protein